MSIQRIPASELEDALRRSGYLIESRVDDVLRKKGFYVDTNAAYPDPATGKSRELDLYAMTLQRAGPDEFDFVFGVLLLECINNPQPVALFTKKPLADYLQLGQVKLAGLPVKIPEKGRRDTWIHLPDWLNMDRYHHYCKGRVATQFCSFIKKKDRDAEWMATHLEDQFDSFRKLCAAVAHYQKHHFESWSLSSREHVNLEMYYPALVVQGELLDVSLRPGSLRVAAADHLMYSQSMWTGREGESYQIDVISERFVPKYLKLVSDEVARTARLLRGRHRDVRKAIDRIARAGRRLRSPEKIRKLLEF